MSSGHFAVSTSSIESLYKTAHWLVQSERYADAACVFRAMMIGRPEDERGWLGLGACHEQLGDKNLALDLYETARTIAAPAPRCELALAKLHLERGEWKDAENALSHAISIAPPEAANEITDLARQIAEAS